MTYSAGRAQRARTLLVTALALGCRGPAGPPPDARLTGHFASDDTAGCTVESVARPPDSVFVALSCQRGPPSENSGALSATLAVEDGRALHEVRDESGECRIAFTFLGDRVRLEHDEDLGACGFGFGVYAHGEPRRIRAVPLHFAAFPADTPFVAEASFAGSVNLVTWGCGTQCRSHYLLDLRSGRFVTDTLLDFSCYRPEYRLESALIVQHVDSVTFGPCSRGATRYFRWTGAGLEELDPDVK